METDGPIPAYPDARAAEAVLEALGEDVRETGEGSGWVSTKVAAKILGVSRRTVQEYVRRGKLEAQVEGKDGNKTYYVSVDSLNALRERRYPEGYTTAEETGRRWERDPSVIRYFCRRGVIPGARKGEKGWLIPASDSPPVVLPKRGKLTEAERREIAALAHEGANRTHLARRYGVERLHVHRLMKEYPPSEARGKTVRHS